MTKFQETDDIQSDDASVALNREMLKEFGTLYKGHCLYIGTYLVANTLICVSTIGPGTYTKLHQYFAKSNARLPLDHSTCFNNLQQRLLKFARWLFCHLRQHHQLRLPLVPCHLPTQQVFLQQVGQAVFQAGSSMYHHERTALAIG